MPKPNDLASLQHILNESTIASPDYFLFMLGTDTVFTPTPTNSSNDELKKKTYENGETLSYMAQLVSDRLGEKNPEIKTEQALSFSTQSVDVLNGPTTLGYEVGERIAQGVFLVLKALAEGKSNVHIAAHSRGAVESILIAHELERIKTALLKNSGETIFQILSKSPCTYTRAAVKKFFAETNESVEVRIKLANKLNQARLNMFLMDPVPGGRFMFLPGTAWRDDRFYVKPPCTSAELLIFRDERTRCFIPIVPNGITPLLIPGHHGTASGNIYSQQFQPVPVTIEGNDTSLVQQLAVFKLLDFINTNTNLFDKEHGEVSLEHPLLDKVASEFIGHDKIGRKAQLLDLYKQIHKNDNAFRYFGDNTAYPYLRREQTTTGARYIHFGGRNYMGLDTIVAMLRGQFVNKEHAFLYLLDHMQFKLEDDGHQPNVLITQLRSVLTNIFERYAKATDDTESTMLQSIDLKAKALLDTEEDRKVTFEAISLFVDIISQKYLRNHLSVEIKTSLLSEIDKIFETLNEFKKEEEDAPINKIVAECEQILNTSLNNTVLTHYKSLLEQSDTLNDKLKYFLASRSDFKQAFTVFLDQLKHHSDADNNIAIIIHSIYQEFKGISPVSLNTVKEAFNKKFSKLSEEDTPQAQEVMSLLAQLASGQSSKLDTFFEVESVNANEFLTDLDRLHENVDNLIEGNAHIQKLIGDKSQEIDVELLKLHRLRILRLAAEIFINRKIDLNATPSFMSETFFSAVKAQAIALGNTDPEMIRLRKEIDHLNNDYLEKIRSLMKELAEIKSAYELTVAEKEQFAEELVASKKTHQEEVGSQTMMIKQLTRQLLDHQGRLDDLVKEQQRLGEKVAADKKSYEEILETFTTEKAQLTEQLADNKSDYQSQLEQILGEQERLTDELADNKKSYQEMLKLLAAEKAQLTEQLAGNKNDYQSRLEQMLREQERLTDELADNKKSYQETLELLAAEKDQLAEQLVNNKSDYQSRLEQMLREQERLTDELADNKKSYQETLKLLVAEKEQLAKQLLDNKSDYQSRLEQMLGEQERLTDELAANKKSYQEMLKLLVAEKEQLTEQLLDNKSDYQSRLEQMLREQERLTDELADNKKSYQEMLKLLVAEKEQLAEEYARYKSEHHQLTSDQEKLLTAHLQKEQELRRQLVTSKEIVCAHHIETQLIPLTQGYINHLISAAVKLNPSMDAKIKSGKLPVFTGNDSDRLSYEQLSNKFSITQNLLLTLTDTDTHPLPSSRITLFTESLQNNNSQLKQHRDSAWKHYFKSCIIGIGIVCSGIIPGIIALLAYSSYAGKSSPLFFANSEGEEFVEKIEASLTTTSTLRLN